MLPFSILSYMIVHFYIFIACSCFVYYPTQSYSLFLCADLFWCQMSQLNRVIRVTDSNTEVWTAAVWCRPSHCWIWCKLMLCCWRVIVVLFVDHILRDSCLAVELLYILTYTVNYECRCVTVINMTSTCFILQVDNNNGKINLACIALLI